MRKLNVLLTIILFVLLPAVIIVGCQQQPEPVPPPPPPEPTPTPVPPTPPSPSPVTDEPEFSENNEKVSGQLLMQVNLRKEQIAGPTPDRLETMKNMGMRVDNLEIQRIFVHLSQELNNSQIEELQSTGIILYLDSWIPPVGTHPTGFILADMPLDKLEELARKDYVVRLDTAERKLEFKDGNQLQVE